MKKEGFTLIELLAVIVILAVIAIIAVPAVLNVIEDSKESAKEAIEITEITGNKLCPNNTIIIFSMIIRLQDMKDHQEQINMHGCLTIQNMAVIMQILLRKVIGQVLLVLRTFTMFMEYTILEA